METPEFIRKPVSEIQKQTCFDLMQGKTMLEISLTRPQSVDAVLSQTRAVREKYGTIDTDTAIFRMIALGNISLPKLRSIVLPPEWEKYIIR